MCAAAARQLPGAAAAAAVGAPQIGEVHPPGAQTELGGDKQDSLKHDLQRAATRESIQKRFSDKQPIIQYSSTLKKCSR